MKPYYISKECDECGRDLEVSKYKKSPILCRSCAAKARWTAETRKEWSDSRKGENNPNFGNTGEKNTWTGGKASSETREKMGVKKRGENNPMYGKLTPDDVRDKISKSLSGENHPNYGKRGEDTTNWQGGLTPKMQAIRNSPAYKNWREHVYARDNWTCQECGVRSASGNAVYLNAHHIHPIKDNKNSLLIFDVNNGITLCADCHNKTKGHEEDFIERYEHILSC